MTQVELSNIEAGRRMPTKAHLADVITQLGLYRDVAHSLLMLDMGDRAFGSGFIEQMVRCFFVRDLSQVLFELRMHRNALPNVADATVQYKVRQQTGETQ